MRFLVDEQLSPRVVDWLRAKGHQADHIRDVAGAATTDGAIVDLASQLEAIIVSKDADFPDLLTRRGFAIQVIWVKVGNTLNRVLLQRLDAEWTRIKSELDAGISVVKLD